MCYKAVVIRGQTTTCLKSIHYLFTPQTNSGLIANNYWFECTRLLLLRHTLPAMLTPQRARFSPFPEKQPFHAEAIYSTFATEDRHQPHQLTRK